MKHILARRRYSTAHVVDLNAYPTGAQFICLHYLGVSCSGTRLPLSRAHFLVCDVICIRSLPQPPWSKYHPSSHSSCAGVPCRIIYMFVSNTTGHHWTARNDEYITYTSRTHVSVRISTHAVRCRPMVTSVEDVYR